MTAGDFERMAELSRPETLGGYHSLEHIALMAPGVQILPQVLGFFDSAVELICGLMSERSRKR